MQMPCRIVIASSSLNFEDYDEATITSISTSSGKSTLTISPALKYDHLGIDAPFYTGLGPDLNMRAEVAVLTRNIVVEVRLLLLFESKNAALGSTVSVKLFYSEDSKSLPARMQKTTLYSGREQIYGSFT